MTLFASPEATAVLGTQTWLMSRIYQPSAYGCYLYSDRPLNDTGSQLFTYEEWLLDRYAKWCPCFWIQIHRDRQEGREKIDTLMFPPTLEYSTGLS